MNRTTRNVARACARAAVALPLAAAVVIGPATAQEAAPAGRDQGLDLSLQTGVSWSDNIGRAPDAEEEGSLGEAGLRLTYAGRGRRVQADLDTNVAYQHYFDDTFDDDVLGGVDGTVLADLVPERLRWFVQENFGQITSNAFAADTPENRENISYFTTGPDFTVRLGHAFSVALSGRYSDTAYETSALDSERYTGSLSLIRQLAASGSLSLNASQERVEFDNTALNTEYDRSQVFARYSHDGPRTGLGLDLGYTEIQTDARTSQGLLARLSLSRRVSASSTITVGAGTQFSDAGDLFRATQGQQGVRLSGESVLATSDPFESRFASAGWNFSRNRTTLGLSAQYGEEIYENVSSNDRTVTTWGTYFTRQLSRYAQLRVYGRLEDEQFDTLTFDDQELQLGAALSWTLGSTLQLRLQYDHFDRDSTAVTTEYTENRASVFATWSPLGRQ
jgi:putative beta-barrel porin BBP2